MCPPHPEKSNPGCYCRFPRQIGFFHQPWLPIMGSMPPCARQLVSQTTLLNNQNPDSRLLRIKKYFISLKTLPFCLHHNKRETQGKVAFNRSPALHCGSAVPRTQDIVLQAVGEWEACAFACFYSCWAWTCVLSPFSLNPVPYTTQRDTVRYHRWRPRRDSPCTANYY